jgi:RNA polymerase sigma factor (sigma-70 family)
VSTDWAEVFRATYEDLVRYLHRRLWDVERAQDLAQEAFVRAMVSAPENPRAWVFRIAINLAKDETRTVLRRKRHLTLLRNDALAELRSAPNPSHALEEAETMESVRRALEQLSERDRDVLLLWDSGLSYAEIADQTGLSPGAVGTTLARARRRLVDAFAALEDEHAAR